MPSAPDRPNPAPTHPRAQHRVMWGVAACAALAGVVAAFALAGPGGGGATPPSAADGPDATRLLAWQEEVARVRQERAQRLLDRLYPGQALVTVTVELEASVSNAEERITADFPAVRSRSKTEDRGGADGERHDTQTSEYEPFLGTRETRALAPKIRALHAVLVLDPALSVDAVRRREIVSAVRSAIGTADDGKADLDVLVEPLTAARAQDTAPRTAGSSLAAWLPWLVALGALALAIAFVRRRAQAVEPVLAPAPAPPAAPATPAAPQGAADPEGVAESTTAESADAEPAVEGPFAHFAGYDARDLAAVLDDAHPQLAAVVLAHLPPSRAAEVLAALPRAVRVDVVRRVASLDHVAPDAVDRAVSVLDSEIQRRGLRPGTIAPPPGAHSAAAMLNLLGDLELLREVEEEDPDAAARIRDELFTFDDVARLDGRALQRVLGRLDARTVALALKAADPAIEQSILSNLSRRAGALVLEERESLGPTPRREVEEAQAAVVGVVRDLLERDEIALDDRAAELL